METGHLPAQSKNISTLNTATNTNDLSTIITYLSDIQSCQKTTPGQPGLDVETEEAINFALIAMAEAEKRIERQKKRIKYLESLSVTDELTQLLNRRGFMKQLRYSLSITRRSKVGGSLMILDLNKFKEINDEYGHSAGDSLLKSIGSCLLEIVRETDVVGRIGGDEFSILMPGAGPGIVTKRIQEIHNSVNQLKFQWNKNNLRISVSIGRCDYDSNNKENQILESADLSMYRQKAQYLSSISNY
jgi:diguanylate cyclase (GGDEF)-like protein